MIIIIIIIKAIYNAQDPPEGRKCAGIYYYCSGKEEPSARETSQHPPVSASARQHTETSTGWPAWRQPPISCCLSKYENDI